MCSRGTLLASFKSTIFFPVLFYHVPPIFLESYSICFGAPTSMSPTFLDDGKDVLSYNLHTMGGICKEGWLSDFLIKFSFGWLQNLTSATYGWMLEHSLHYDVIVAGDVINDKEAIIECILYHLQYSRSLNTFWASLEVLLALMFFWFLSSLFFGITLPSSLGIEEYSNGPLASSTNH